jgi:hypothetical protein
MIPEVNAPLKFFQGEDNGVVSLENYSPPQLKSLSSMTGIAAQSAGLLLHTPLEIPKVVCGPLMDTHVVPCRDHAR